MPYIGNSPGTGTRNRFIYTATASQTTFSGADDNGKTLKYADSDYVDVYLNGICLVPVTDYTSTSKTSIVLTQAASLNDTLEVVAYDIATISDTVSKADGGQFDGDVTVNASFTVDNGDIKLDGNYPTNTGNVALGNTALDSLGAGNYNTAVGHNALTANTDGSNTAFGAFSLAAVTTGGNNVAVGREALEANTGDNNTSVGYQALETNTTGGRLTAVGYQAGKNCTATGTVQNAFFGNEAGLANTSGTNNTFIGGSSGSAVTTGSKNSILGAYNGNQGGLDIRTSSNNIVLSDGDGNPRGYFESSGGFHVGVDSTQFSNYYTTDGLLQAWCDGGEFMIHLHNGNNNPQYYVELEHDGATIGHIRGNGSSVTYSTTSDYRVKENVVDLTGATDRLKQLEPKRFNFIANADRTVDGFLAHEVQSVVPEAITGTHNEVDADGNPVYQGIDQSKLVPLLTAALQEAIAKIETLETEMTSVKSRLDALEAG